MSREEARGHVRAAQEAELAGNKEGAVRHLERAALVYVRSRQMTRAVQMYAHALRLTPGRTDLRAALNKAEVWAAEEAENPNPPALEPSVDLAQALDEAVQLVDPPPPTPALNSNEFARGPVLAPDSADAWCSFCCRPAQEVGALAQGPAGAFICAGCLQAALGVLGSSAPLPLPTPTPAAPPSVVEPKVWMGPAVVLEMSRAALAGRGGPMVVVGGTGVGKTTFLARLAAEFPSARKVDLAQGDAIPPGPEPILVDHLEAATGGWAPLAGRPFVAALRTLFESTPLDLQVGEEAVTIPFAATTLPHGFPLAAVVALPPMDASALQELLQSRLEVAPGLELGPGLREALVARAVHRGRGAHGLIGELAALAALGRSGPLEHRAPPKKVRKRRSP